MPPTRLFIRVKDRETGHEFDMPETHPHITKGLVERVKPKLYPPSPLARRPKHHLDLAADAVTPEPAGEGTSTPDKENSDG
jgi:hypothetical protein